MKVVDIIFGMDGKKFFDEESWNTVGGNRTTEAAVEVEDYLQSLCQFQWRLKRDESQTYSARATTNGSKWDIFVALTGHDLWVSYRQFAETDHHGKEVPKTSRVMGVTGGKTLTLLY